MSKPTTTRLFIGSLIAEDRLKGSRRAVGFRVRFMDQALRVQLRTAPTVTGT